MSTINVRPSRDAAGSVNYVLYGRAGDRREQLMASGKTRDASFAISMADGGTTPAEFIERAQQIADAHGRKVQLQSYVLAFHPDEFDVTKQADLDRIRDVAVKLAEKMHSADYLVAVHADSAGRHGHAHILVMNHDNLTGKSLTRFTSWKHGLRQLNDELMADEGLSVLPDPERPKSVWELRRESFKPGGFEQVLGDKVYAALLDPRSVDREGFERVLAEHGVTLAVTNRDGWSYKMRRADNGKLGRRKASSLTPEFTAAEAQKVLDLHAQHARPAVGPVGDIVPSATAPAPVSASPVPVASGPVASLSAPPRLAVASVSGSASGRDLRADLLRRLDGVLLDGLFTSMQGFARQCARVGVRVLKQRVSADLCYQLEGHDRRWNAADLGERYTESDVSDLASQIGDLREQAPPETQHLPVPQLLALLDDLDDDTPAPRRRARRTPVRELTPAQERQLSSRQRDRSYGG